MGRSHWLLRIGTLLCYFGGGLATFIDAHLSREWIASTTGADKVMPGLSLGLAFVVAVLASAFGAVFTTPWSWKIIFMESKRIARISNRNERSLTVLGVGVIGIFLTIGLIAIYGVDIVSTQAQIAKYAKSPSEAWFVALLIVFSSDVCFLLANILGFMSVASSHQTMEFMDTFTTTRAMGARKVE
ncbi:MAG: hypothetical protein N3E45_17045 [Oscillatoriaceae bacterium SKW80]|nr:hypothetical protein [Oscillatoriaceae bacterium SKW80]HIK27966.1 hypothetical protein [Oscillatoriaceae cyanobacterium M7585_C2015_266]